MARFPRGLAQLIPDDLTGTIEGIVVRPKRRSPVRALDSWDIGTTADHGRSKSRAVTLISAEHVDAIAALAGVDDLAWGDLRRNLLVRGLNVNALRGRRFTIGAEVVLEGTKPCDPCSRMPQIVGPKGYAAMMGIGGTCAAIVAPGTIRIGDAIRILPVEEAEEA